MRLLFPDKGFFELYSTCAELVEVGLRSETKTMYGAIGKSLNEFFVK